MHVTADMMHRQLRLFGVIARAIMPRFSDGFLRVGNAFMDRCWAGHGFSRKFLCEQRFIDRADGSKLRICVYTPRTNKRDIAVLWLHGGGYATGIPEQDVGFIGRFTDMGCTVFAPDYRRSDKHPYPAALEDAHLALAYLKEVSPAARTVVGGDSAGGGLCAALCLYNRDHRKFRIDLQLPLYPMLDDRPTETSAENDAPMWNSENNRIAWDRYLRGIDPVPIYAAPARADDLGDLPPLITFVGDLEPFYRETVDYAARIRACGGRADLLVLSGCFHAFDMMCPRSEPAKAAWAFVKERFL